MGSLFNTLRLPGNIYTVILVICGLFISQVGVACISQSSCLYVGSLFHGLGLPGDKYLTYTCVSHTQSSGLYVGSLFHSLGLPGNIYIHSHLDYMWGFQHKTRRSILHSTSKQLNHVITI